MMDLGNRTLMETVMLPRFPTLYEINTRIWLEELGRTKGSPATLADVPDETLDWLASCGFDCLWLLGVWQTGAASRTISLSHPEWREEYQRVLPDFRDSDIAGSPFAIKSYTVHTDFGGNEALACLRDRLRARGIQLVLDFVPNHTALDHPWVIAKPDFYIPGSPLDLEAQPQNFTRRSTSHGSMILAHGRDPYFPGWPDTLQLDYRSPRVRAAMAEELGQVASMCDGVRCDMAMLLLTDIFLETWKNAPLTADATRATGWEFWAEAIGSVRQKYPDFLFMAEAYWDREWALQQQGFDYTYDKRLYDRLLGQDALAVRSHLWADYAYQAHSVRFLENHDEPRIAGIINPELHEAAAIITASVPGMRFFHDGQLDGRKTKLSVHLGRRPKEPKDERLASFYERLLDYLKSDVYREGDWRLLECRSAWHDNPTFDRFLVFAWEKGSERSLVCVNYGPTQGQCLVRLPWQDLGGKNWRLADQMSPAVYDRPGYDLLDQGLYLDLPAWGYNVFELTHLPDPH